MLDIIFENREKRYGAYFLRKNQHWHEWVALAMVCGMLWAGFWGWNWLKEPVIPEKELLHISCCCGWFGPPPEKEYEVPILPPCPLQKIVFKIPVPVPAWKPCECDDAVELKPNKKLPAKLINHPVTLIQDERNETTGWFCDWRLIESFPDHAHTIIGELAPTQPELSLYQVAQLINPEIIPQKIWRKIQKKKISLSIQIDPVGNPLSHRLEGKLPKRFETELRGLIEDLRFIPEIQAGQASSTWVEL